MDGSSIAPARARTTWPRYLAAAGGALTLLLASLGPEPSAGLSFAARLAFWAAHVATALALLSALQLAISRIGVVARATPLAQIALVGTLGAVAFAPFALLIDGALGDLVPGGDDFGFLDALIDEVRAAFVPVAMSWVLLNAPRIVALEPRAETREAAPDCAPGCAPDCAPDAVATTEDAALFRARLPRRLGTDLVALSAELHYLRVHTRLGDDLILFAFGRAVEAGIVRDGFQTHRSHWVRLSEVEALETVGERLFCRMRGGSVIPVSRSRRAALRAALEVARGAP